jgi:glycosyltransferase involved in cell wall biosynthesis
MTSATNFLPSVFFSVGVPIPGEGMGNHAYYLVEGLYHHRMLDQAYVMQYHRQEPLAEYVHDLYFTERIAYRIARYTHINQYVLRDNFFDFWVARHLRKATIFYGWTHHALWSLKKAKRLNMLTVLERANAHPFTYLRLLEDEYKKWGITAGPYHPLVLKKHLKELQETDYIAVTSQFSRHSLLENGIPKDRILMTPLGVDAQRFVPSDSKDEEVFRVIYVGQLCLRKGLQYLLAAWTKLQLDRAELVLIGDLVGEMKDILEDHLGRSHTIRILAHTPDPVALYQQASICILPTLEDGFGLVVLEAMACGLPVIVTEHTGAKDCVRPGRDGFIIPPYSTDDIADTLRYCYDHRSQLTEMGQNARQQAQRFPWSRYQDGIATHLRRIG